MTTIVDFRGRVKAALGISSPSGERGFSDTHLDEHVKQAVEEFSIYVPAEASADLTVSAGTRTLSVAGLTRFLRAAAVELAITPLTLFHFHQYALGGSLVTLAMAPLIFSMLIVAAFACAMPNDALFGAIAAMHHVCGSMNGIAVSGWFTAPPLVAWVQKVNALMPSSGTYPPTVAIAPIAGVTKGRQVTVTVRWKAPDALAPSNHIAIGYISDP